MTGDPVAPADPPGTEPDAERNPGARHESAIERLDRQFQDLLQELRVSQAGVQILFAFLLGIAFTPVFETIDRWQRSLYVGTLITTTIAAMLFIGPVSFHRIVFRQKMRASLVAAGNWMAIAGLFALMVSMVGAVLLAVSVALGISWATVIASALLAVFVLVWYVLPLVHRWRGRRAAPRPS